MKAEKGDAYESINDWSSLDEQKTTILYEISSLILE
jgi:hypothetical protein